MTAPYDKTNISTTKTKIVLSLHYNKQNRRTFANGNKITDFSAKESKINDDLRNILKDFSESDTKKTGLYGSVYYFGVDNRPTSIDNILKIRKYLMNELL